MKIRWCSLSRLLHPPPRYIWARVRFLRETDKAVLVLCGREVWIPKSRIEGIRMRRDWFEVRVKETVV